MIEIEKPNAPSSVRQRPLPTVSVVVPTRNRGFWLGYVFSGLARQVYPCNLIELLVVDNSSEDETEEIVRGWTKVLPFRVAFLRKSNEGPASSRNFGAAHSVGDVIAFTDSDCIPDSGWLYYGVRALAEGVGLVTGPIHPRRTDDTHFFINAQLAPVLRDDGLYRTANMIVPRLVFEEVGGFDEEYALGSGGALLGGEDTDLGWRIRRRGYRAVFSPTVNVVHLATPISMRQWLMRPESVQVIPKLVRTIPELRKSALWKRYFLSRLDFFVLLGTIGVLVAIATRWWPFALFSLGFVWVTRRIYVGMARKGRFDKALAIGLLLWVRSALNMFVLVGASARHHRLVL